MTPQSKPHFAACHCGSIKFKVHLSEGLKTARRCSCSFCAMRGAVAVTAPLGGIEYVQGQELLTLYQFNSQTAKHYFCSVCGIYTHHQRRSNPNELGINVACLDGISPFDFPNIIVNDGVNHPSDGGDATPVSGTLKFVQHLVDD